MLLVNHYLTAEMCLGTLFGDILVDHSDVPGDTTTYCETLYCSLYFRFRDEMVSFHVGVPDGNKT